MEIQNKDLTEQELITLINKYVNTENGDLTIQFDNDIKIQVLEYKHEFNDGYTITYQNIMVGQYEIDMCHAGGSVLVKRAKQLQRAIKEQGVEQAVLNLTQQKMFSHNDRMWF